MLPSPPKSAVELAQWAVTWKRDGKRFDIKFRGNYADAEELYLRLVRLGVRLLALRSTNVGFPPPERFMPRMVWKTVKGRRKQMLRVPMRKLNAEGIWWCPYCRRFRRFEARKDKIAGGRRRPYWSCPLCNVRHTNWYVYTYNPIALHLTYEYPYNYKTPRRTKRTK